MQKTFRVSTRTISPLWLGCAAAAICFASPLGLFEKDSSVTLGEFAGHAEFNAYSDEYTVSGAGGEIGGKADGFHYVWKQVTGDVAINADARFARMGDASHSQMALMLRQSLDPDATYVAALVYGDGKSTLQYRDDKGASSRNADFEGYADSGLVHMSLRRRGDSCTIAIGRTGKWGGSIPVSRPITVIMSGPVYVGLAVGSPKDARGQVAAVFNNVSVDRPTAQ